MPIATSDQYCDMLDNAKRRRFVSPAVDVVGLEGTNATLEGFAEARSEGIAQVSSGGGAHATGSAWSGMALGAQVLAEAAHSLSARHDVLIALHTDHCHPENLKRFVDPLIEVSEGRLARGEPPICAAPAPASRRVDSLPVNREEARNSMVMTRSMVMPSLSAALLSAALLAACGTVTKIPNAWRNPAHEGVPYQKLFVIGVGENDTNRRLFEDQFAAALSGKGGIASPSYTALPHSQRLTETQIRGAIRGGSYDGVVVTRLLGVEEKTEYVPPRTYTVPGHYYGYYSYYGSTWDVVHEPGYYQTHTIVRLETNLYDVGTGDLVWSGQSETFNPSSLTDIIDSVTKAVATRLSKEGLIP